MNDPSSYTGSYQASGSTITDIDQKLVEYLQENNDMSAFSQLVNKYKKMVFGFCYRYTGNEEDARDITQEIFIKVFRNIRSFRRKSKFSTWLYRIMMNCCHDYSRWRKYERMRETSDFNVEGHENVQITPEPLNHSGNPEEQLLNKELGEHIRNAVSRLGFRQRTVLILKDFQGRTYEEISILMKMKPGTVKSTIARARLNVAINLKGYYHQ